MTDQPHALYRFYGEGGVLLYVGITSNPGARWKQHETDKPWWSDIRGITVEHYASRTSVLAAERLAIEVEKPLHNKVRPSLPSRKLTIPTPTVEHIIWICDSCGDEVKDGAGYVHINTGAIHEAEVTWKQWAIDNPGPAYTGTALLEHPDDAPWLVHHTDCDPDPGASAYWIAVERIRTFRRALEFTLHLQGKRWLRVTDWSEFMRRRIGAKRP